MTSAFVHPYGHIAEANQYGLPARVDYRNLNERWRESGDPRIDANLHGAGFAAQDAVKGTMAGKERDNMALANALYKGFYLAGGPSILGANTDFKRGDIEALKNKTGNKFVGPMLGASALADLADAYNIMPENQNLSFTMDAGTPMLMYTYQW